MCQALRDVFLKASLYNWKADAIDLLIDVEGIDVGHATDIVYHRHDALFQVGVVDVILAAHSANELLGVEASRADGGIDEDCHEGCHNLVT